MKKIRKLLNEIIEFLNQIKQLIWYKKKRVKVSILNISTSFPQYLPNSRGTYNDKSKLTIQTINQVFPFLSSLCKSANDKTLKIIDIQDFPQSTDDIQAVNDLKILL